MFKPLELMIGLRYTRAKRRNHFISFISMTSMIGIILGVWALITVMSIMNGFHKDLRDRILFVVSHVTISGHDGFLDNWQDTAQTLESHRSITAQAPFLLGQGMLTKGKKVTGALIRGVDVERERQVSEVMNHIVQGDPNGLKSGDFGIILGKYLARSLGVTVGEKVTVVAPKGKVTPAGLLPRMKRFTVVGIFEIDMYEYDSGIALVQIDDLQKLLGVDDQVTGLRLKLDDVDKARRVRWELAKAPCRFLSTVAATTKRSRCCRTGRAGPSGQATRSSTSVLRWCAAAT